MYERILGSLTAAALGDALGAPTEGSSRAEITQHYGGLVRDFQPRAVDASGVGLRPGEVTDDTSQLVLRFPQARYFRRAKNGGPAISGNAWSTSNS